MSAAAQAITAVVLVGALAGGMRTIARADAHSSGKRGPATWERPRRRRRSWAARRPSTRTGPSPSPSAATGRTPARAASPAA
ncbi:DUF6215 domain-containing protein [Streptomyces sp. b94]|uniref:DUF6215 domain-containing protein n=1 Tax=Streptomyces sp. b94 TaxID=1827634 RepID=UPI001FFD9EE6|nr:DUF6215 domain-containing protein [Streptomyces sp. b94]